MHLHRKVLWIFRAAFNRASLMKVISSEPASTKRLTIRLPQEYESDLIASLWVDPEVTEHIGGPRDRASVAEYFQEYAADPKHYAEEDGDRWWSVIERSTTEFMGLSSLLTKEVEGQTEIELGYFFLPSFWGKGYATEASEWVVNYAFKTLGLDTLIAIVKPSNSASISVAKKVGMHFEQEVLRSDDVMRQIYRMSRPDR